MKHKRKKLKRESFYNLLIKIGNLHIQYLEQLRQVIGLKILWTERSTLVEYKKEAFSLFEILLNKLKTDLITILLKLKNSRTRRKC